MSMYIVEPMKRVTAMGCQLSLSGKPYKHIRARPVMEKRMKAMYPLTVCWAPLSDALPVAVLRIQCQSLPIPFDIRLRTYTIPAASKACETIAVW